MDRTVDDTRALREINASLVSWPTFEMAERWRAVVKGVRSHPPCEIMGTESTPEYVSKGSDTWRMKKSFAPVTIPIFILASSPIDACGTRRKIRSRASATCGESCPYC